MKRNRLIRPSKAAIFSDHVSGLRKYRMLLILSLLAISSIFITQLVSATSEQSSLTSTKTTVIALPNLADEMQALPTLAKSTPYIAPLVIENKATELALIEPTIQPIVEEVVIEPEVADIPTVEVIETAIITAVEPVIKWQEITVKSGDNLSRIFPRVGLTARDVYDIAQLDDAIKPLLNLKPGQVLRFDISQSDNKNTLQQLQLQLSPIETLTIEQTDNNYQTHLVSREIEEQQQHAAGIIENSLFEAGVEAGLSDKVIMELAYIFGWDIDFALDLRTGDSFKLIYTEQYLDGNKFADGDILAAEFTNKGKTYRAVRYEADEHYYTPEGDSMRKTFSRSPVHFSRISSRFNPNRKHPVLKTSRPHKGVDYAASRGTPITATGNGKVDFVGRKGGYGRTVVLSHGGKYTTLYAHMSNYKKGLKRGKRVKQGDTIGYIGSSGLATGPHLHYEFRVNGVHRNPLTVALPKAEALAKKHQANFEQQAQPLLAQLDDLNDTALALNE